MNAHIMFRIHIQTKGTDVYSFNDKYYYQSHHPRTIIILQMVTLKAFDKFESTTDALSAATHLVDSKLPKGLRKFLKAEYAGETGDKLVC